VLIFQTILQKSRSFKWKETLKTLLPFFSAPAVFIITWICGRSLPQRRMVNKM
jgi:hypothetical protein